MNRSAERLLDEYLAASARAGNRKAFGRLAKRWQPKLVAHAYRLIGDAEAARDIAQDAWADIVKGLQRLDDVRVFPAWAFRIVTRRAADAIRRNQKHRKIVNAFELENQHSDESAEKIEARAGDGRLREAINTLPMDQRAAIALFYRHELSVAEIAAALRVPAGTVKTRLMHARRKLRSILEGVKGDG